MEKEDRRIIGLDLMRVQFGWPIGMPLVRNLKDGLWEVRSDLPGGRIARVMLCFHDSALVALHGFIKKSQKTPHRRPRSCKAKNEGGYQMSKQNRHVGSSLDEFLAEEGLLEEIRAVAIKEAVAFQVQQAMEKDRISKVEMARRMNTSRAALDRFLDPGNASVTLQTLTRAARAVGRNLKIELL
jgi:antitoxin HicB